MTNYDVFQSPFTWRYGTDEMRTLWSEAGRRRLWRRIWVELARAQSKVGLVTEAQVADLQAHAELVDIPRALEIEAEVRHDLMAEVKTFAEQCPVGGGIIHLGATSADIQDNADALRVRAALDLVLASLHELLTAFAAQIDALKDHVTMAYTHIQPAEPTTMGYRLAFYAQDLLADYSDLKRVRAGIRGKGLKGAVGTAASYAELLDDTTPAQLERWLMDALDLDAFVIAGQTYPRKQDWRVVTALSGLAGSLAKFALDLRILQTPMIGEWGEPFGKQQVGSSAMPFKRNPVNAEKLNSLARLVTSTVDVAHDNAVHSVLERTLDDSANRREILPVAFLAIDEMLRVSNRIIGGLRVDEIAAQRSLDRYGTFAAVERVLMAVVKAGADRQEAHEHLREHSLHAWAHMADSGVNPLAGHLVQSAFLRRYLSEAQIADLLDASAYVGDAPARAAAFAATLRTEL